MDRRVIYILKTSNYEYYVRVEHVDERDFNHVKNFSFHDECRYATGYDPFYYDKLKELADKYGFKVCKKTVTTEIQNEFYTVEK